MSQIQKNAVNPIQSQSQDPWANIHKVIVPVCFQQQQYITVASIFMAIPFSDAMQWFKQRKITKQNQFTKKILKAFKKNSNLAQQQVILQVCDWAPFLTFSYKPQNAVVMGQQYWQSVLIFLQIDFEQGKIKYQQKKSYDKVLQLIRESLEKQKHQNSFVKMQVQEQKNTLYCQDCQKLTAQLNTSKTKQNNFYPNHRRLCFQCHFALVQNLYWALHLLESMQNIFISSMSQSFKGTIQEAMVKLFTGAIKKQKHKAITQFIQQLQNQQLGFLLKHLTVLGTAFNYNADFKNKKLLQPHKKALYQPIFYLTFPQDQTAKRNQTTYYAIHMYFRHNPNHFSQSMTKYKFIYKNKVWHTAQSPAQQGVSSYALSQGFIGLFNLIFKPLNLSFMKTVGQTQKTGKRFATAPLYQVDYE